MIVAIINQTAPVGVVDVTTFVEAVNEAAGVTQYVNFFVPPLAPGDWLGFDSGFVGGADAAAPGFHWAYDFGAPGLLQVANPVTLPGEPFYGVPIFFGCDQPAAGAGEYYVTNGTSDRTNWPTLDDRTQAAVPVDGVLSRFAWSTESSDATTVIKILIDGIVERTFNLTGLSGVVVFATPATVVTAGQLVAVEYDSGQAPNEGTITVYLEPKNLVP